VKKGDDSPHANEDEFAAYRMHFARWGDAETPLRVEELGVALAYWAAYYRKLPGTPHLAGALDLGDALDRVPLFLSGQVRPGMPREVYLLVMQAHREEFSAAVDSAAEPDSVEDALSSLTEAGARLYLANSSRQPLVLLHTVIVSAALRLLLPHLRAGLHKTALAYVWQNVVATVAAYGDEKPPERDDWPLQEASVIIERSIAMDDPHALKFARGLHPGVSPESSTSLPGSSRGLGVPTASRQGLERCRTRCGWIGVPIRTIVTKSPAIDANGRLNLRGCAL
jgi:hypothetical protein